MLPSIIAATAAVLLLFIVYFIMWLNEKSQFLGLWTIAWGIYCIRLIFTILQISWNNFAIFFIVTQLAVIASSYFSLWGTETMTNRKISPVWLWLSAAVALWNIIAKAENIPSNTIVLPNFILSGAIYIWTGIILAKSKTYTGITKRIISTCFILWGLHKFDYPFLIDVKELAPWGFQFSATLSLIIAVGIVLLYFQKNKQILLNSQKQLQNSLLEKNALIKEIHHRVKNNLQIVSSIINLQEEMVDNKSAKNALKDAKLRIRSIALVHEKLYKQGSFSKINIKKYFNKLCDEMFAVFQIQNNIKLTLDIKDSPLSLEKAVPLGQITTELITNSIKHAFPKNSIDEPAIIIKISKSKNSEFIFQYQDNGIGLPKKTTNKNNNTLGINLINILSKQLNAAIHQDTERGVHYTIRFKELQQHNKNSQ